MASNPRIYHINNESLSIKNIINYLFCLNHFEIIPNFTINTTDTELQIITIYSYTSTLLPVSGHTIITYNIYTKKWKGIINLASHVNGMLLDNTYINIQRDFPFIIDNSLLKINYQHPYVEYIIESNYIEDIIEPSLNVFTHNIINPYNMIMIPEISRMMKHYLNVRNIGNEQAIQQFYLKVDAYEKYLLFLSKKNIINNVQFMPDELWEIIYNFY